jgi:hypothetical protein
VQQKTKNKLIKRTVVLDPAADAYLRKVWAMLIDQGEDANYSTALNMVLLATIVEAKRAPGSLPRDTRRFLWEYVKNASASDTIKGDDTREAILKFWGKQP